MIAFLDLKCLISPDESERDVNFNNIDWSIIPLLNLWSLPFNHIFNRKKKTWLVSYIKDVKLDYKEL